MRKKGATHCTVQKAFSHSLIVNNIFELHERQ